MINKRVLVKNLLAFVGENSFYDKKRKLNFGEKEGKAKFLKHVCALANSNPKNNSFLLVGVEDESNLILGVDFFDDSKIQNLVNAYIDNPPVISYENIPFAGLEDGKVIGLVTISSNGEICSLKKNIWKYYGGTVFFREGSTSLPKAFGVAMVNNNEALVKRLEQNSRNNIAHTLDGVMDFMTQTHKDLPNYYKVFNEQFVVCWAGIEKQVNGQLYYSRVDIELITEQVKLFYSALDEITIVYDDTSFTMVEFVQLGMGKNKKYYPLEEVAIHFNNNGTYLIERELLFTPPIYDMASLTRSFNIANQLLAKLKTGIPLDINEQRVIKTLSETYLICYLNGIEEAKDNLEEAKHLVKKKHPIIYLNIKESLRILRKVRYN